MNVGLKNAVISEATAAILAANLNERNARIAKAKAKATKVVKAKRAKKPVRFSELGLQLQALGL